MPVWPPHQPIDPVVDQHRYSGNWWKVQQEEARALGEEKAREAAEPEAKARADWRGPRWWEGKRA